MSSVSWSWGSNHRAGFNNVRTDGAVFFAEESAGNILLVAVLGFACLSISGNTVGCGRLRAASSENIDIIDFLGDLFEISGLAELVELRALVAEFVDVELFHGAELSVRVENGALESWKWAALAIHVAVGATADVLGL